VGHDPEKWEPVFGEDHARSKSAPVGEARKIRVLGASGLIGRFVTDGAGQDRTGDRPDAGGASEV
jgi:hypothetical protein